jgi:hypothetical protein
LTFADASNSNTPLSVKSAGAAADLRFVVFFPGDTRFVAITTSKSVRECPPDYITVSQPFSQLKFDP